MFPYFKIQKHDEHYTDSSSVTTIQAAPSTLVGDHKSFETISNTPP